MSHDGSMASTVEAWIVTTLQGLTVFADRDVQVFQGTTSQEGEEVVAELMAGKSSPCAVVAFEGDRVVELEEGDQAYEPTYAVYVAVKNLRPGTARCGETEGQTVTYGTNGLRDLLRGALHDKQPNASANGFHTEYSEFRGAQVVFQRKDCFILRAEVIVRETPS